MSNTHFKCKIVLIGDSGVGKSCIIERYLSDNFTQNMASSSGASYASKSVDYKDLGKSLTIDIWDTAGQEKFRSLTRFFYKDASIAFLVYDITKKDSFKNIKEYWYPQILENCTQKDIILYIIGNKGDLFEREEISDEEAKKYAKTINAKQFIVSALTGSRVNEIFYEAGKQFVLNSTSDKTKILEKNDNQEQNQEDANNNNNNNNIKLDGNNKKNNNNTKNKKCC